MGGAYQPAGTAEYPRVSFVCIVVGIIASPALMSVSERAPVWLPYLALGILFPVVNSVAVWSDRKRRALPLAITAPLILAPIVAAGIFAGAQNSLIALAISTAQVLMYVRLAARLGGPGGDFATVAHCKWIRCMGSGSGDDDLALHGGCDVTICCDTHCRGRCACLVRLVGVWEHW